MRASERWSVAVLVHIPVYISLFCALICCIGDRAFGQSSDQIAAERTLGPQWKQLSCRAGMIFTGTVIAAPRQMASLGLADPTGVTALDLHSLRSVSAITLSFHVDHAIAGVETGQEVTIREWAGALPMQRPMWIGQRVLIFLYPPSRLGFTSPVGGSLGQISLDPSGRNVSSDPVHSPWVVSAAKTSSTPIGYGDTDTVSVNQIERAVRSAREK